MNRRIYFLSFLLLTGCGGSSTAPPPPIVPPETVTPTPPPDASPLNLSTQEVYFSFGASNKNFVVNDQLFATDGSHNLFKLNNGNQWEKLNVRALDLIVAGNTLINNFGALTTDMGQTWSEPPDNDEEIVPFAYQQATSMLFGARSKVLLVSQNLGATWEELSFVEKFIEDILVIDDNHLLIRLLDLNLRVDGSLATYDLQNNELTYLSPPDFFIDAKRRDNGDLIALSTTSVYLSQDNGETWSEIADVAGNPLAHIAFELQQVGTEFYTIGGTTTVRIRTDNTLETVNSDNNVGYIYAVNQMEDKIVISTSSGLHSVDLTEFDLNNRLYNIQPVGVPTTMIDAMFSSSDGDLYHFGAAGAGLIKGLNHDLSLFSGNIRAQSTFDAGDGQLGVAYFSNVEQGFGGVGYFDSNSSEFTKTLVGYSARNLVNFSGYDFVQYSHTATSGRSNWVLQSDDNMQSWNEIALPSNISSIMAMSHTPQCGEINLLVNTQVGQQLISAEQNLNELNWISKVSFSDNYDMVSYEQATAVWGPDSFWYQANCSDNFTLFDLSGGLTGNITDVLLTKDALWFGTNDGELWKLEGGRLYHQQINGDSITQLFMSSDDELYIITENNVLKVM